MGIFNTVRKFFGGNDEDANEFVAEAFAEGLMARLAEEFADDQDVQVHVKPLTLEETLALLKSLEAEDEE